MKQNTPKKIKVKDVPSLVRDSFSKAIICTDRNNYAHAKARKKHLAKKEETINQLKSDIEELKTEHAEVMRMLRELTNK